MLTALYTVGVIPGTPKDLTKAAEIVAGYIATLVLHTTYHVDSLPAFTATPIRSLKQQSTKVTCLKPKRLFVILKVTLCFDHNYYVHDHVTIIYVPISGCPDGASRYIAISCSIKSK